VCPVRHRPFVADQDSGAPGVLSSEGSIDVELALRTATNRHSIRTRTSHHAGPRRIVSTRRSSRRLTSYAFVILAAAVETAPAAELHVPSQYPTIQAAIQAANHGDSVIVAPGTYREALNLLGKRITVRGSDGPDVTTLDGAGLGASIVTATGGETLETVIEGFTLTGGRGTSTSNCVSRGQTGGAVLIRDGAVTFRKCAFLRNGVGDGFYIVCGGAVYVQNGSLDVSDTEFTENGGYVSDPEENTKYGGAIFICGDGDLTIERCRFDSNGPTAHGGGILLSRGVGMTVTDSEFSGHGSSHGGAIRASARERTVEITRCAFRDGVSSFGAGVNVDVGEGGAAYVTDCTFADNEAGFGGGLMALVSDNSLLEVTGCRFTGNVAHQCCNTGVYHTACWRDGIENGLFFGGGADLRTFDPTGRIVLHNSVFYDNSAVRGGGLHLAPCSGGTIEMTNCTVADNTGGGGVHLRAGLDGSIDAYNSIVWGNEGEEVVIEKDNNTEVTVTYSDVEGGLAGKKNLDQDPLFVDGPRGGYYLSQVASGQEADSPCVDRGKGKARKLGLKKGTTRTDGGKDRKKIDLGYHHAR